MMRPAAIYARVSSDRQKEDHTIASQTQAVMDYATAHGYLVPQDWIFEDEGVSGAVLVRPALEAVRDLAAQGQIEAVLVHSPDRLSRKYAYQVLLIEEFARQGVETTFVKAPRTETPEDQLVVQFQGMIAEYERAQIAERSRRGKRHHARAGSVNVLSGAPYGYRYVRKTEAAGAYYEIIEAEAGVVRLIYEAYTTQGLSINAIARLLNDREIQTRKRISQWERSTVWAILRNPAYKGLACYGKTEARPRQRITRPLRRRSGFAARDSANHERPREDWIEIPVPPLVSAESFDLAQELLVRNKRLSRRRTIEPSLLQGLLVCQSCGYALYRTSTRTSKRRIHYYRCLGSDAYRYPEGARCDNRPIRQDHLDGVVWQEILRLLAAPALIQGELERRLEAAQKASPGKRRKESLEKELKRLQNACDRLLTAYQEDLLSLDELRQRMADLRKRQQTIKAELAPLEAGLIDKDATLRLAQDHERLPLTPAHQRRDAGHRQAPEHHPSPGQGSPGRPSQHNHTPRYSGEYRRIGAGHSHLRVPRHVQPTKPRRLPFAFRESSHRSWRTSTCTMCSICGLMSGAGRRRRAT